jgi:hypothetical protein
MIERSFNNNFDILMLLSMNRLIIDKCLLNFFINIKLILIISFKFKHLFYIKMSDEYNYRTDINYDDIQNNKLFQKFLKKEENQ